MIDYSDRGVVWYAMLTTYQRELKAKAYLDERGIESFVPMERTISVVRGVKRVEEQPAIHNLIFIKADISEINKVKERVNFLHNRLIQTDGVLEPIIIPAEQMDQFIAAIKNSFEKVTFVDLCETALAKGTPVRITDGEFKGYEGVLTKIKGRRDRRVAINIEGVLAYTIDVDACYIEKR